MWEYETVTQVKPNLRHYHIVKVFLFQLPSREFWIEGPCGRRGRLLEISFRVTGTEKEGVSGCLDDCWQGNFWKHHPSRSWLFSTFSFLSFWSFLPLLMCATPFLFTPVWLISNSLKSERFIVCYHQGWCLWLSSLATLGFFGTRCHKSEQKISLKIKLFIHKTATFCLW